MYSRKNFTVVKEKINEDTIAMITKQLNSKDFSNTSFNPRKLAPAKAGIESKKEILLESTLLNFKILATVIVMPALLTPGMSENI